MISSWKAVNMCIIDSENDRLILWKSSLEGNVIILSYLAWREPDLLIVILCAKCDKIKLRGFFSTIDFPTLRLYITDWELLKGLNAMLRMWSG